ncbi:GntR family transcriptional regulator [Desulfofustis glycolicus]|uniref:DNA-binding transcriptional regulator, GntR family n=1 Tax=Desulfofustis glycolicus DSM 9705 TaxID=1121409 RepID=A0A1M5V744_9BACT|nr:GntR family transcriptional regulator [Desulfofustis glycolicus]MCB2214961.1 GntR family transcriptional regulator [Desulfobulbaceae bacterium]SHH70753.1 DNA-binding transcriptional regulator, GntR family [Desulfofustis glycolicus DSM 9705]
MRQQLEKKREDLEKLRRYLSSKPRDLLLFEFLLQKNCKTSDVLKIRVDDLSSCQENERLVNSTWSEGEGPVLTTAIKRAFNQLLMQGEVGASDLLFRSRKGGRQLTTTSVSRLIHTTLERTALKHYRGLPELRQKLGPLTIDRVPNASITENESGSLSSVKTASIQKLVYKDLVQHIIRGTIPPGQKLFPEKIARQMHVSTTPVREALSRLEAKGFAVHHPQRGWVVSELSQTKLKEILDLRILLECEAISRAAKNIAPETLKQLKHVKETIEHIDQDRDPLGFHEANRQFHLLAYKDCGSAKMLDIIKELWDLSSPYYQILFRQSLVPKPTSGINHHYQIIKALQAGDSQEAREWLKKDIEQPADFVFRLFDMYARSIE